MGNEEEILDRYQLQLAAIATLDRAYYNNKVPTAKDRAAYFARQEELQCTRAHMYEELSAATTKKPPQSATLPAEPEAKAACAHQVCLIKHDALNKLSVALGRCQLLAESAAADVSPITDALNSMTKCLRKPCPRDTKQSLVDSFADSRGATRK